MHTRLVLFRGKLLARPESRISSLWGLALKMLWLFR